jgi:hypothetical protein
MADRRGLWWTKWHLEWAVHEHFSFTLTIIIPLMLHTHQTLRTGTTGQFEAAEPSNSR